MKNITKQITEITFNEELSPFIAKTLADRAVSNADFYRNINKDNAFEVEEKIRKELEINPDSPDEGKLSTWGNELNKFETQMKEWDEVSSLIVKQIVAVYPDYEPKATATKSKASVAAEMKARFAKK